jgi:predicted metal-binding integral membrane protein DUF2182
VTTAVWTAGVGVTSGTGARFARSRRQLWLHPEWWSLALSALAWFTLVAASADAAAGPTGWAGHREHVVHVTSAQGGPGDRLWAVTLQVWQWLFMVVAMMVPLVIGPIRTTAARSLWRRRHRAIATFLAGYLLPWAVCGIVLAVIGLVVPPQWQQNGRSPAGLAAALAVAAMWQSARAKRRALVACHESRPLAPGGWQAWRDCLLFGLIVSARCLVSCWALMLVCVLAGHSLPVMAAMGALGMAERTVKRATARVTGGLLAGGAVFLLVSRL